MKFVKVRELFFKRNPLALAVPLAIRYENY